MQVLSLEAAIAEISKLKDAAAAAAEETTAVRAKLHNAVRKGKTIDAERAKRAGEAEALAARVAELEESLRAAQATPDSNGAQDPAVSHTQVDQQLGTLQQDKHALQQQLQELAARERESTQRAAMLEERLQQEAAAAAAAKREAEVHVAEEADAREARLQASLARLQQENAALRCRLASMRRVTNTACVQYILYEEGAGGAACPINPSACNAQGAGWAGAGGRSGAAPGRGCAPGPSARRRGRCQARGRC